MDVGLGLLQTLDHDALLLRVIPQRRVDRFLRQQGAVYLHRRKAVQRLHHCLVRHLHGLLNRLSLHQLRRHAAGGAARAVMELAGVKDVFCKSLGTDNVLNIVKATAEGLKNLQSPEEVAQRRGISVSQIYGWKEN